MEISQQIKELEKRAKDSEYWKDRYNQLQQRVKNIVKELDLEVNIKFGKPRDNYSNKLRGIAEDFYRKLETEEIMEVNSRDVSKVLAEKGYSDSGNNIHQVKEIIKSKEYILSRKEGANIILYYFKTGDDKEKEELSKSVPTGTKVSVLG